MRGNLGVGLESCLQCSGAIDSFSPILRSNEGISIPFAMGTIAAINTVYLLRFAHQKWGKELAAVGAQPQSRLLLALQHPGAAASSCFARIPRDAGLQASFC